MSNIEQVPNILAMSRKGGWQPPRGPACKSWLWCWRPATFVAEFLQSSCHQDIFCSERLRHCHPNPPSFPKKVPLASARALHMRSCGRSHPGFWSNGSLKDSRYSGNPLNSVLTSEGNRGTQHVVEIHDRTPDEALAVLDYLFKNCVESAHLLISRDLMLRQERHCLKSAGLTCTSCR